MSIKKDIWKYERHCSFWLGIIIQLYLIHVIYQGEKRKPLFWKYSGTSTAFINSLSLHVQFPIQLLINIYKMIITWLTVINIALSTELFCNYPLSDLQLPCVKRYYLQYKVFVGLVWLTSNHMFGWDNFGDKSPSWFLTILKLPQ